MSTWSIKVTHQHVCARFGNTHAELSTPALHTLVERQEYARYHFQETLRLLEAFRSSDIGSKPLLLTVHGSHPESRADFDLLITQIGAHALACVLSIHSVSDVLAFAIYHVLGYGFQPKPLRERDISANTVEARLRKNAAHSPIANLLSALCADSNYKHVAALANKSKHQSLVKPILNEDLSGTRTQRHEMRFVGFMHDGKSFPEVEVASLLEPIYRLASHTTIDVGNHLNALFAAKQV